MNSRQTTLSDMVGKTIEILGRTFTIDWIDAPGQPDNGKIMVQSADTEIYHIGCPNELFDDVMSEISSELMRVKEAVRRRLTDSDMKEEGVFSATVGDREKLRKRDLNAGVHGKKGVE